MVIYFERLLNEKMSILITFTKKRNLVILRLNLKIFLTKKIESIGLNLYYLL